MKEEKIEGERERSRRKIILAEGEGECRKQCELTESTEGKRFSRRMKIKRRK